jgi:uncharacterized membrane protein
VARKFYSKYLGYRIAPSPNWIAAILFYLLFVAGILVFVVLPGSASDSVSGTLLRGALYGLIAYSTYGLTNLATIKDWTLTVTVVDMIWGTVLSVIVNYIRLLICGSCSSSYFRHGGNA